MLCKAQNAEIDNYVKELNNIVKGFRPDDFDIKNTFLIDNKLLSNKLIIAMGESTHGTKEFNLYRSKLIKELILYSNLKTALIESDYCASLALNDFLLSDKIR